MAREFIVLDENVFTTKKSAQAYVNSIRMSYEVNTPKGRRGVPQRVVDPHHIAVLYDVLKRHPRREEFEADGVVGFDVWDVADYHGAGFRVLLRNKCPDPFSYMKAFKPVGVRPGIIEAFREAISDQVRGWKTRYLNENPTVRCAISGEVLTESTFQVDHHNPTFIQMLNAFMPDDAFMQVEIKDAPNRVTKVLVDAVLARRWSEYHRSHATYRPLKGIINASRIQSAVGR